MRNLMVVGRTSAPVRHLDAEALGVGASQAIRDHGSNRPDDPPLREDDPRLQEVRQLLEVYGGVIFTGPPGTSKSWYAAKIGMALAGHDEKHVVFLQFHPSYQYEDFMLGIVPRDDSDGFELVERPFLRMCRAAENDPEHSYVIVIDELSRADPGRVFGEALTYVERSKRGLPFHLAMGEHVGVARVPENLVLLATMNPLDRGVDEVDAAFERRFAKIAMEPDTGLVAHFLDRNGVGDPLRKRILAFFSKVNKQARKNPLGAVGHTFFMEVSDTASLQRLWEYQLRFLFEKAFRLNPDGFADVEADWERIFRENTGEGSESTSSESAESESPESR